MIVTVVGAVIMILELVGSRILAPTLGTSLFVWTSLIGVILGSLSFGYWQGGKLADRKSDYKTLFLLLIFSSILIAAVAFFHENFLSLTQIVITDIRANSLISALILFAPVNIVLGMVSPYAAKLKLTDMEKSGQTIGNLYALSTLGSILGTFGAGFWLIPTYGSTKILVGLAIATLLVSIILTPKIGIKKSIISIAVLILIGGYFTIGYYQKSNLIETSYSTIKISDRTDRETGRPVRLLTFDPRGAQSAIFTDNKDNDLVSTYTKFFRLADYFNPASNKTLLIGGGAFVYPRDYLTRHPNSTIDVVEIDPKLTSIARQYFNFQDDPRLNIVNADGRVFLNQNKTQYDSVLIDAFNSLTPPYNLTSIEAIKKMNESLKPDGVVIANIVSPLTGPNSEFARAEYKTFSQVFPQVYLFLPTSVVPNPNVTQNIMLVAIKGNQKPSFTSNNIEEDTYLQSLWKDQIPDAPIITDDFAPVEYYLRNI